MSEFSRIRYRTVIEFLTLENVQPQQIHGRMSIVYVDDVPSNTMVSHWVIGLMSFIDRE